MAAHNAEIAQAEVLALQFRDLLKGRDPARLDQWLQAAEISDIPEMKTFANGIRRDYAAVRAGIHHLWSNGPVEGQVHRLKLLKRQMYGRAGFHLVRMRVLPLAAEPVCHAQSP
jgi:transposase